MRGLLFMTMSFLANIGIILINIYVIWKIAGAELDPRKFDQKKRIQFIILESIVGVSLMMFSATFMDVRFDFRSLLFSLCMKFLGKRITIGTIAIVAIMRFLFGGLLISVINLAISMVFMLTISYAFKLASSRFGTLGQLLAINYYYIFLTIPGVMITLQNGAFIFQIIMVEIAISTVFTMIIYSVLRDVYHLASLTVTDGLTGLYNSRKFYQDLDAIPTEENDHALIILDIDNFKTFNDLHGHLIGDNILKALSATLHNMCSDHCAFYRFGGEEFVTILKDDSGRLAYSVAEKIEDEVSRITILDDKGGELKFTVSIGIAYQRNNEELLTTFYRADKAMFVAKTNGKNQIIID